MSNIYKLVTILFVLAFVVTAWMFSEQRAKTDAVQTRLNKLCRVTQTALQQTAQSIRLGSSNKEAALRRINGEGEITGALALSICPSTTFDVDAWTACRDKNDEACLLKMLDETASGIHL